MLADEVVSRIRFNDAGLVPAIAQRHDTGEVLMLAWMNADAVRETLTSGRVCYWSRSRRALWRKGESSGHVQRLVEFRFDCDGNTNERYARDLNRDGDALDVLNDHDDWANLDFAFARVNAGNENGVSWLLRVAGTSSATTTRDDLLTDDVQAVDVEPCPTPRPVL